MGKFAFRSQCVYDWAERWDPGCECCVNITINAVIVNALNVYCDLCCSTRLRVRVSGIPRLAALQ